MAEATRIFARDGYRSGSLAAIAEAAGLTQQGLLHYFPTKADLLLAVVEQRDERTAEALGSRDAAETALDAFEDLVTRLTAGVRTEQNAGEWSSGVDPEVAARILVGLADGLRLQRLLGHPDLDHAAMLANILRWLRTGEVGSTRRSGKRSRRRQPRQAEPTDRLAAD